jgi:hypothetical protein
MSGCVVAHNQAGVGAGIRCGGGTLTVLDCTFSHNDPGGSSAAIYCETIALSLERTIVAFSGAGVECGSGVTVTLSCCNVYGNADGDWVGCIAGQSGTNGNFSEDPLFCNPAGDDFHLNIASPCTAANNSCSILVGALPVECGSRIQCPPDQLFAAVPGHVTFWELTGFVITNETGGNLSFDYHLDATGPGTLVDNGDPASLSGTTPVLAPGQPYVPPPAALQFPQLSEYAEQTVTYHIAEVGNPTAEDSCTTTIIFEASVPVAVRAFEAHSLAAGIELEWSVTADESFDGFEIYRSTGREDTAVRVNSDPIPASARSYLDGNVESGKTYRYTLSVVAGGDAKVRSQTITVRRAAAGPRLFQNHPNPFNPTTTLSFALPQSADVDLSIYTPAGQLVKRLASGIFPAGVKEIAWDGTDRNGNRVGSGVYFYRLKAGAYTETRKMILLK